MSSPTIYSRGLFQGPDAFVAQTQEFARVVRESAYERFLAPTAVNTSATVAMYWQLVLCDPTAGGFSVQLPLPNWHGARLAVKNVSASVNAITLEMPTGFTIDGAANFSMTSAWGCVELACDAIRGELMVI